MQRYADRHVVITGAAGGLGGAVVERLQLEGAILHTPTVDELDLADEAAVTAYYAALPSLWASIHLVGGYVMRPIADTTLADLDRMLSLNVRTCFLACREAVRAMRASGGGGRIVNVAARPALVPAAGLAAYAASKAAVATLTASLAAELAPERIWVNAIVPSIIDTPANRKAMPDADHAAWPQPAQLATAIGFLAGPDNELTTGTLLPVYGNA